MTAMWKFVCLGLVLGVMPQPVGTSAAWSKPAAKSKGTVRKKPAPAYAEWGVLAKVAGTRWVSAAAEPIEWSWQEDGITLIDREPTNTGKMLAWTFRYDRAEKALRMFNPNGAAYSVKLTAPDAYEVYAADGSLSYGCRLSGDAQQLDCLNSSRAPYILRRASEEEYAVAIAKQAERHKATLAQLSAARAAARQSYGDLSEYLHYVDVTDTYIRQNAVLVGTQTVGKNIQKRIEVAFEWQTRKDGKYFLRERWMDRRDGSIDFDWLAHGKSPQNSHRANGIGLSGEFVLKPDGTLQGKGKVRDNPFVGSRQVSYRRIGDVMYVRTYKESDKERTGEIIEEYVLQPGTADDFNAGLAEYRQFMAAEQRRKESSGGGGIAGVLGSIAGAVGAVAEGYSQGSSSTWEPSTEEEWAGRIGTGGQSPGPAAPSGGSPSASYGRSSSGSSSYDDQAPSASAPRPAAPEPPKVCYSSGGPYTQEFSAHEEKVNETRDFYVNGQMCSRGPTKSSTLSCSPRAGMATWRDCKISYYCEPETVSCKASKGRQE